MTGFILLVIGIVGAWSSTQLKMGSFRHPGVGFLPFGLSIILIILSLALIISRWKKETSTKPFWTHRSWVRPLLGVVILGLYALVIDTLGFPLTTLIFLLIWLGIIERTYWLKMVTVSIGVTLALYLIFGYFLEVPVPMGFFK